MRPRHFRLICDPAGAKPWVVQYSTDDTETWADVHRFRTPQEAVRYVDEVAARDRTLLEEADR